MRKVSAVAVATSGAVRRLKASLHGHGRKIVLSSVGLVALAAFAQANRYETTRLSNTAFVVTDRIFGDVLICGGRRCSPVEMDRFEPEPQASSPSEPNSHGLPTDHLGSRTPSIDETIDDFVETYGGFMDAHTPLNDPTTQSGE